MQVSLFVHTAECDADWRCALRVVTVDLSSVLSIDIRTNTGVVLLRRKCSSSKLINKQTFDVM